MRFVEITGRGWTALALVTAAAGCASVGEPLKPMQQAVQQATTPGASAESANAAKPTAVQADAPVSAAVQHPFDDASRALRAGHNEEAERGFRALAQAHPELGGPHANLGVIYRRDNKLPESAAELEQAVRLNPKQPLYLNQLGITYRQQGHFDKAREAYEKAIEIDAGCADAQLNLGILNDLYLGDPKRALDLYGRYLALSPNGDALVTKWVAELKTRKPTPVSSKP